MTKKQRFWCAFGPWVVRGWVIAVIVVIGVCFDHGTINVFSLLKEREGLAILVLFAANSVLFGFVGAIDGLLTALGQDTPQPTYEAH